MNRSARAYHLGRLLPVALIVSLVLTAGAAQAERPKAPELMPENTLVYVRIADSRELVERFNETAMGRMLKQEQMAPLMGDLYGVGAEAFTAAEDEIGVSLSEILAIPQGEVVFAMVAPQQGPPAVIAILDVGDSQPVVEKLIQRGEQEMANDNWIRSTETAAGQPIVAHRRGDDEQLFYFFRDEALVITTNLPVTGDLLAQWKEGGEASATEQENAGSGVLADNEKFKTIMNRCRGSKDSRPQLTWFVDPIELARTATRGNIAAQASLAILPVLGLDGVQGVGGSMALATEKFDMVSHLHISLETPRSGIVEMVALRPGDTTPEPWVPHDVASYATLHWDMDLTYETLTQLYDSFRGEGRLAREVGQRISDPIGVDFEKELLAAMEGRVTVLTWFEPPANFESRARLLGLKLNDAKQFQGTIDKVAAKFPEVLEKKQYSSVTYYALKRDAIRARRRARRGNAEDQPAAEPQPPRRIQPCMGIVDDYLVIADRPSFIEKIVATKRGAPSLASDLEYKLIASKIRRQPGGDYPAMVSFERPESAMRFVYDLVTSDQARDRLSEAAADNDFFSGVDRAMRDNPLPPFAVLQQFLAPAGSMITDDETGIHYMGFALRRE